MANSGYCSEVGMVNISRQYLSQYDIRALATPDGMQLSNQLLIGDNNEATAEKLHLQYEKWNTNSEYEKPDMEAKSKPNLLPLILNTTISNLEPHTLYNLYRYNHLDTMLDSQFNAYADLVSKSGSTYIQTEEMQSNETAIFDV